jgi:hypothetical protein
MKTTITFWQKIGNVEHEVAADYYHNGVKYTGECRGPYYTGRTRPV